MYTIGSLFSGIGGLELGLEVAGVGKTIWQVEQDGYCQSILAKHWPTAERFDDIKTVGTHNLRHADLICGGFPCQDISLAGSGAGLAGERSGLWGEMHRVIREIRPRYAVVENVPALAGRGLGTVLGNLASIGYDAQWDCISAASIGACHHRDRIFIIAWRNVADTDSRPIRDKSKRDEGRRDDIQAGRESQPLDDGKAGDASKPLRKGPPEREGLGRSWTYASIAGSSRGSFEPGICPVLHDGFPGRVAQLKALGNAVVPAVAYQVGRALLRIDEELTTTGRVAYR